MPIAALVAIIFVCLILGILFITNEDVIIGNFGVILLAIAPIIVLWIMTALICYIYSKPIDTHELTIYNVDTIQVVAIQPDILLNLNEKYHRYFKEKTLTFDYYQNTCIGIDFLQPKYKLKEEK